MWEPIDRQYLLQKGDQLTKFQLAKLKKSKRFCLLSNNDANYRELWNSSLCTVIRHRPNGHTRRSWSNDYKIKKVKKSDGQQFHQFQQNEPSQIIEHKKEHDIWRWKSRSWFLERHRNLADLNLLMWSHLSSLFITWSSTENADINKR